MTFQMILFIVLVVLTFYNLGVQAYIHFEAYPLFANVGKAEFGAYLDAYDHKLMLPLLIPYGLTMLVNLVLLFTRPETISLLWIAAAFVFNFTVAVVTMVLATPIYNRIKAAGEAGASDMAALMRTNAIRLGLSAASSVVIIILLLTLLGG